MPVTPSYLNGLTAKGLSRSYGLPLKQLAEQGDYFIATNPTIGTAITMGITATRDAAKPQFYIFNSASAGTDQPTIVLDFLTLKVTTPPASATAVYAHHLIDTGNRYVAGGSALVVTNPNAGSSVVSPALCYVGALTTFATVTASVRYLGSTTLRSVIPVLGDELTIQFGGGPGMQSVSDLAGTTAKRTVSGISPVILPPQWGYILELVMTSNASTAMTCEPICGFYLR